MLKFACANIDVERGSSFIATEFNAVSSEGFVDTEEVSCQFPPVKNTKTSTKRRSVHMGPCMKMTSRTTGALKLRLPATSAELLQSLMTWPHDHDQTS